MNEKQQQEFMRQNNTEANSCGGNPVEPDIPASQLELMRIESNYNTGSNSWHPSRIDAFKIVVQQKFLLFPLTNKIDWDTSRGLDGKLCLKLTVRTEDLGQLSTDVPIELLESDKCPVNLPDMLFDAFKEKFENKKERLFKEWQREK